MDVFSGFTGKRWPDHFPFTPASFSPSQKPEQAEEGNQGKGKEEGATLMMDRTVDDTRAEMSAEPSDRENAKAISEDAQGQDEDNQGEAPPGCLQEKVRRQQAGNEEHQTGVNAAALLSHANGKTGQLKHDSIAQHWSSENTEKEIRCFCGRKFRGVLEEGNRRFRQGDHEEEEGGRKGRFTHPVRTKKEKPAGHEADDKGRCKERQKVSFAPA